jgi:hypothetical protein
MTLQEIEQSRRLEESLRAVIVIVRTAGNLDLANKLSEFLHWIDCDYPDEWLAGMFRGMP